MICPLSFSLTAVAITCSAKADTAQSVIENSGNVLVLAIQDTRSPKDSLKLKSEARSTPQFRLSSAIVVSIHYADTLPR